MHSCVNTLSPLRCFRSYQFLIRAPIHRPSPVLASIHSRKFHHQTPLYDNLKVHPRTPPLPSSFPPPTANWKPSGQPEYVGPSNTIIRIHKTLHMSMMAGAVLGSPYILQSVSEFPPAFQVGILGTTAAVWGVITLYIMMSTGPYVAYLRWLPHTGKGPEPIEMVTFTWNLRRRTTRVYNPAFLIDADKPFTVWKLARRFRLPPFVAHIVTPGDEEVVAETFDRSGKVIGSWIVTWGDDGQGYCRSEGTIQRYVTRSSTTNN